MTGIDRELLAERTAAVVRHLDRVAAHLPADPPGLTPLSTATDTVVLHLWRPLPHDSTTGTAAPRPTPPVRGGPPRWWAAGRR